MFEPPKQTAAPGGSLGLRWGSLEVSRGSFEVRWGWLEVWQKGWGIPVG